MSLRKDRLKLIKIEIELNLLFLLQKFKPVAFVKYVSGKFVLVDKKELFKILHEQTVFKEFLFSSKKNFLNIRNI
jgi:hypothetical protein